MLDGVDLLVDLETIAYLFASSWASGQPKCHVSANNSYVILKKKKKPSSI